MDQHPSRTGEYKSIEGDEDVRHDVGGMPLHFYWFLTMSIDILVLIRGFNEFVTVTNSPALTFLFSDPRVETYRRLLLQLNLIWLVDGKHLFRVQRMPCVRPRVRMCYSEE